MPQSSRALVVGVSQYQHVNNLAPNQDATGVRDVLANPRYCAYPPERVELLENAQATRANILAGLRRLRGSSTADSRTFFYFSGHGGQSQDGAYLIPVDTRSGELESTAISAKLLSEELRGCLGEVTVVLDCCYAAGMAPNVASPAPADRAKSTDLAPFDESLRSAMLAPNRVVLAASSSDAFAYGAGNAPYGLFTGHMIAGLSGAASSDGKDVGIQQLFEYVQKQVVLTAQGRQQPMFIAYTSSFYPLTRYPEDVEPNPIFEKDVYVSYDLQDPHLQSWVAKNLFTSFEQAGVSFWGDRVGGSVLPEDAIVRSKYVLVLLTEPYLKNNRSAMGTTMAILQAVDTQTPRFIPILRDRVKQSQIPLSISTFVGLDLSDANLMAHAKEKERLINRLRKEPHAR